VDGQVHRLSVPPPPMAFPASCTVWKRLAVLPATLQRPPTAAPPNPSSSPLRCRILSPPRSHEATVGVAVGERIGRGGGGGLPLEHAPSTPSLLRRQVRLYSPVRDAEIFATVDGSAPSREQHAFAGHSPLSVVVNPAEAGPLVRLRAVCMRAEGGPSEEMEEEYRQARPCAPPPLPPPTLLPTTHPTVLPPPTLLRALCATLPRPMHGPRGEGCRFGRAEPHGSAAHNRAAEPDAARGGGSIVGRAQDAKELAGIGMLLEQVEGSPPPPPPSY
jgi:hypothetical protein